MLRTVAYCVAIIIFFSACGSNAEVTLQPTETVVLPTRTPAPSPTPREQMVSPSPTTTQETFSSDSPTAEPLPDLSGVEIHEVTHLMDPRLFQVSLDGWPAVIPDDLFVRVGLEIYTCDILFPDRFPNRVYCWGKAPIKGTEVILQVILEDVPQPLLEIPFIVPYPSGEDN